MDMLMGLLFLFASLGVINGLLLAVYLFLKKEKTVADVYFAGLLLAISVRIGKSVYLHFTEGVDRLILQIGLSACIFIGPFFYLYLRSRAFSEKQFQRKDLIGLGILAVFIIAVGSKYPYRTAPEVWNSWLVLVIYCVWKLGLILGIYTRRAEFKIFFKNPKKLEKSQRFDLAVLVAMTFMSLSYFFAFWVDGFTYLWASLIFTAFFYYLIAKEMLSRNQALKKKKNGSSLTDGKALFTRLNELMQSKALFKNPKLKLDDLAQESEIPRNQLSKILNEVYPNGFAAYVNDFRIEEAKKLIETRDELSLEGIGYEAGFNSKSAFFASFKARTSTTPAQFKKSLLKD